MSSSRVERTTLSPWPAKVAGPYPGEESCGCGPVGTMGIVPADDPRYLGGHVDAKGLRHDPLKHAADCPRGEVPGV